jgi:hypothetical protein
LVLPSNWSALAVVVQLSSQPTVTPLAQLASVLLPDKSPSSGTPSSSSSGSMQLGMPSPSESVGRPGIPRQTSIESGQPSLSSSTSQAGISRAQLRQRLVKFLISTRLRDWTG